MNENNIIKGEKPTRKSFKDLEGMVFGRLKVIDYAGSRIEGIKSIKRVYYWNCKCVCGKYKSVCSRNLKAKNTSSCGCYKKEALLKFNRNNTTHGAAKKGSEIPEYSAWRSMKRRCKGRGREDKENYKDRGITICKEWINSFETFLKDLGLKPSKKHSLERIDNNKGYFAANCKWATSKEQSLNRRNTIYIDYKGERRPLINVAEELKLNTRCIRGRWYEGERGDRLLRPIKKRSKRM